MADPPPVDSGAWLTTTAGSPAMAFTPGAAVDGLSVTTITFDNTTSIQKPAWADGGKYKIYVRARNTAGQELNTTSLANQVFIYDVTAPTITAHASILGLSTMAAGPSEVNSVSVASGAVSDNAADILDQRPSREEASFSKFYWFPHRPRRARAISVVDCQSSPDIRSKLAV